MSSSRKLGLAIALLALTIIVYWPVKQAGFIWDDGDHVTANAAVNSPDGLIKIWSSLSYSRYYPLTLTTFWAECQLWGLNPLPFHVVNVLLHGLNAILIYLVLRRLHVRAAWVAAAVWAIHPVNVESVAWITELKNVQSGTFFFLAILSFLQFEQTKSRLSYACALGCGLAAILSKTSTVILPLVLLLCAWWQRQKITGRDCLRVAPFFLIVLPMALLTIVEQQARVQSAAWSLSLIDRLGIAGRAPWFYAWKLLWPPNLIFIYPRWNTSGESLTIGLAWLGIATVAAVGWKYRQKSWARAGTFGCAYFVAALLPVLGFFNVFFFTYSFVADHFQYLASLGIIALACAAVSNVVPPPRLKFVIAGAALLSLGFLSHQRTLTFVDEEVLWRDTIARNPRSSMAYNDLGLVLYGQLQYRHAIEIFERGLLVDPHAPELHYNLGLVLSELGQYSNAVTQMADALQTAPNFPQAHNGLGYALVQLGQFAEAIPHFQRALEVKPDYVDARNNLGRRLMEEGQLTEAEDQFRLALQAQPGDFASHENLGVVLFWQRRLREAIFEFQEAVRLKSEDPEPHQNLANIFTIQDRLPEAREENARVVSLSEQLGATHYRIATALQALDDPDGAIKHLRKSINFRPNLPEPYLELSKLLVEQNRLLEAIATLRQAAAAIPGDSSVSNELARLSATQPAGVPSP